MIQFIPDGIAAEVAAQAAISGYDITLSAKTGPGGYGLACGQ
tara:strand:- start:769 stop:894 length:126 start_codon:yes stop_codon:yes gene_type:complete